MIHFLQNLQLELAHGYTVVLGHIYECSLFDMMRLLSGALFVALLLKLAFHLMYVARLRKLAKPLGTSYGYVTRLFCATAAEMKVKRLPQLFLYYQGHLPAFTVGSMKPLVFISPAFVDGLAEDELKAVLAHELGHIRRGDNLVSWLLEVVFAAIPLLMIALMAGQLSFGWASCLLFAGLTLALMVCFRFFIGRVYRSRCEHACDDYSIAHGTQPLALASSLIKAWQWIKQNNETMPASPMLHAFFLGRTCLERRVERLLHYQGPGMAASIERGLRLSGMLLLVGLGFFLLQYHVLGSFDTHIIQWRSEVCCSAH